MENGNARIRCIDGCRRTYRCGILTRTGTKFKRIQVGTAAAVAGLAFHRVDQALHFRGVVCPVPDHAAQYGCAEFERSCEIVLFEFERALDEREVALEFRVSVAQGFRHDVCHVCEHGRFEFNRSAEKHSPPDEAAQNVTPAGVARNNAVAYQEGCGSGVFCDHSDRSLHLAALPHRTAG